MSDTSANSYTAATDVIGRHEGTDYILDLDRHHQRYANKALDLAKLIDDDYVRIEAAAHDRYDAEAMKAQQRFRYWMSCANFGVLFTSVFSSAAMAWSLLPPDAKLLANGGMILSVLAVIATAVGAAGLFILREGALLGTWMRKRAAAETHRIEYFRAIMALAIEMGTRPTVFALEYFRRYQLEVQMNYYHRRQIQHEASARVSVLIGALGALLATGATLSGVVSGEGLRALGAVSVLGAALSAFSIGRDQMTQDRRNAERYDRTYSALTAQFETLRSVRRVVAEGHTEVAMTYVDAVNEQLSNEHREWLEQGDSTRKAIAKIEESLNRGRVEN